MQIYVVSKPCGGVNQSNKSHTSLETEIRKACSTLNAHLGYIPLNK